MAKMPKVPKKTPKPAAPKPAPRAAAPAPASAAIPQSVIDTAKALGVTPEELLESMATASAAAPPPESLSGGMAGGGAAAPAVAPTAMAQVLPAMAAVTGQAPAKRGRDGKKAPLSKTAKNKKIMEMSEASDTGTETRATADTARTASFKAAKDAEAAAAAAAAAKYEGMDLADLEVAAKALNEQAVTGKDWTPESIKELAMVQRTLEHKQRMATAAGGAAKLNAAAAPATVSPALAAVGGAAAPAAAAAAAPMTGLGKADLKGWATQGLEVAAHAPGQYIRVKGDPAAMASLQSRAVSSGLLEAKEAATGELLITPKDLKNTAARAEMDALISEAKGAAAPAPAPAPAPQGQGTGVTTEGTPGPETETAPKTETPAPKRTLRGMFTGKNMAIAGGGILGMLGLMGGNKIIGRTMDDPNQEDLLSQQMQAMQIAQATQRGVTPDPALLVERALSGDMEAMRAAQIAAMMPGGLEAMRANPQRDMQMQSQQQLMQLRALQIADKQRKLAQGEASFGGQQDNGGLGQLMAMMGGG